MLATGFLGTSHKTLPNVSPPRAWSRSIKYRQRKYMTCCCCNSTLCVSTDWKAVTMLFCPVCEYTPALHKPELAQRLFTFISCVSQDSGSTSVYTYSSHWLFVACFSMDTVLQQLICHDMFLLCTTSQIPPVVRSNRWQGTFLGDGALCWNDYFFNLFICLPNYLGI